MAKVVLITGASSGIGKVTAEYLLQKGYKVYGTSRNPKPDNFNFPIIPLEVTDIISIENAIQYILDKDGRIDVLINNAGRGITGPIEETPSDEISKAFETNFFGAVEVMKSVMPVMREQKSGLIINITSIAGYTGLPYRGIYSACKSALEIVTESIRMEVKEFGIKVTNIAPGDIATNIVEGRYHTPIRNDSPYKESYQKNLNLMNSHVTEGLDPVEMAKVVERVIEKTNPKIHYKFGNFMQKFSILLKRVLPDLVYEKLLMNYYKM
jgi:short-subunit dehydrogenase